MDLQMMQDDGDDGAVALANKLCSQQPCVGADDDLGGCSNQLHHHHDQQPTQEGANQAQDQQPSVLAPALTETIASGLSDMEMRRQQLHAMIDELTRVGLEFLDGQRGRFVEALNSLKSDVDRFCEEEAAKGQAVSLETLAARERLHRAQLLVQSLGGAVCASSVV